MSFNKIILVGNLGRDPELRYTPQGTPVCNFSVATNEKRKDRSGESQDVTTWFRVTLWGRQAETASKYLTKGRPVYIEGRLRMEEWTDKDGKTRTTIEVNATDLQFIGGGRDEGGYSGGEETDDREMSAGMSGGGNYSGGGSGGGGGANRSGGTTGGGNAGGGYSGAPNDDIGDDDIPF